MEYKELAEKAREAMKKAYCPYSKFRVGAALLTKSGKVYTGVNVENAAYSSALCAERTAVFKAVSEGETEFVAIAVATDATDFAAPCGGCRQVLYEFSQLHGSDIDIILTKPSGETKVTKLSKLFPQGFGPKDMGIDVSKSK